VTAKCALEASTTPAANNREVTEGERLVGVCNNEFFNGPNLPWGDLSFGSIYKLRIVVAEALQARFAALQEQTQRTTYVSWSGLKR